MVGGRAVPAAPDEAAGFPHLFVAVMLGVGLAGLGGMVIGVMAVAGSGVSMMRRGVMVFVFIALGGFAVMVCRFFMMLGGVVVMLAGRMLVRHEFSLEESRPSWPSQG